MGMWVRSEYAGALAVLSTWTCALLPWSATLLRPEGLVALTVRFLPLRVLYIFGAEIPGERPLLFAWQVPGFVATPGELLASHVWLVGAAVFLLPLGLSVAYYAREDAVERRVDAEATVALGAAVAIAALALGIYFQLPGAVFLAVGAAALVPLAGGVVLVRTERRAGDGGDAAAPGDPAAAIGLLLSASGLLFLVAAGLLVWHGVGTTVPVGGLFQVAFGVVLLKTERV
jgi:uncharacterized protein (TIGR04206 family)